MNTGFENIVRGRKAAPRDDMEEYMKKYLRYGLIVGLASVFALSAFAGAAAEKMRARPPRPIRLREILLLSRIRKIMKDISKK